jgi:NAD(P)-dependent dehydrogenase (short-subunit alcohol dehydrogenase family)
MDNPFTLQNKTIIVTGASSGIGRACAIQYSRFGANVILLGRNTDRLEETLAQMTQTNFHKIVSVDLGDFESLEAILKSELNGIFIDGFIHCGGISSTTPLRALTPEKMEEFFRVNYISAIQICKIISKPQYLNKTGASYVFLSSVIGHVGELGKTIYSGTKGALLSSTKSLALELASKKIRVNCISPGVILTPMTQAQAYTQNEESLKKIKELHPLGLGTVNDIANASQFLLSDSASWITGTSLIVDGGYTAK